MSQLNDPNREAVGLPPIWTGAGDPPPPPEGGVQAKTTKAKAESDEPKDEPKAKDEHKPEPKAEPKK